MNNPAALLKVIADEIRAMKKYIKIWLKDDVRQHDARLVEYKKQTAILKDIKQFLEARP